MGKYQGSNKLVMKSSLSSLGFSWAQFFLLCHLDIEFPNLRLQVTQMC